MPPDREEELVTPRASRWPIALALAGVALLAGLVVVRAVSATQQTAQRAPVSAPPPSASSTSSRPGQPDPRACPPAWPYGCTTVNAVPEGFQRAVEMLFPGARPETASTDLLRGAGRGEADRLWYRIFTARSDSNEILILVRHVQAGDHNEALVDDWAYGSTARVAVIIDQQVVQVSVATAGGQPPPTAQLRDLARDARLVTV